MRKLMVMLGLMLFTAMSLTATTMKVMEKEPVKMVQTQFCKGWDSGFCEGYKEIKGDYAICPVTPICPIPKIGESSDSYKDGYNRGFVAGMRYARSER